MTLSHFIRLTLILLISSLNPCLILPVQAENTPHSDKQDATPAQHRPGDCPAHLPGTLQWATTRTKCPPAIDDTVSAEEPTTWHPWTHHPSCLAAVPNPDVKFCAYTDSGHGRHGISLITLPAVAAANADILADPHLSSVPAPGVDPVLGDVQEPPYQVVEIPGKGMGVVATKPIRAFEVFMGDTAAVLISTSFPGAVRQMDGYELLHRAVETLARPEAVLGLGRSNPGHRSDVVEDVMRTNSFQLDVAGLPHMAIFPEVSRINHACKPNAFMRFSARSFASTVMAYRDIQPGEEITISYASLGLTFQERQAKLANWGFRCTCDMCTAQDSEIEASDGRRSKIAHLKTEIVDFLGRGKVHGAIGMVHRVMELMAEEGLEPLMSEQLETLARIHLALGEDTKAVGYAKRAVDHLADHGFLNRKDAEAHLATMLRKFGR